MRLAPRYRMRLDEFGRALLGKPVSLSIEFLADGDTDPSWLSRPSADDLHAVWPIEALRKGLGGKVLIGCQTTVEGFLDGCRVIEEWPPGTGFGQAALNLTHVFRMKPAMRGGEPVLSSVTIPINFEAGAPRLPGRPEESEDQWMGADMVFRPPWGQTPEPADVNAAYPPQAIDVEAGQATLRCRFSKMGGLHACDVISEIPRNKGFGAAAKRLTPPFRLPPEALTAPHLTSLEVDVRFDSAGRAPQMTAS